MICGCLSQVAALRNQLASLLEADEEWKEAAQVLMGINLDANYSFVGILGITEARRANPRSLGMKRNSLCT